VLDQNTLTAFHKLQAAGVLPVREAEMLIAATRLIHDVTQVLRLCLEESFNPTAAPQGLKELIAGAGDAPSFEALEARLHQTLADGHALFDRLVV
jgi:hypothetical protein